MAAFSPARIGLIIAGLEVPHCHLHVIPIESESDLSFARPITPPTPPRSTTRPSGSAARCRDGGHGAVVPPA